MKKILVTNCIACPYRYKKRTVDFCVMVARDMDQDTVEPPTWCPLQDEPGDSEQTAIQIGITLPEGWRLSVEADHTTYYADIENHCDVYIFQGERLRVKLCVPWDSPHYRTAAWELLGAALGIPEIRKGER